MFLIGIGWACRTNELRKMSMENVEILEQTSNHNSISNLYSAYKISIV